MMGALFLVHVYSHIVILAIIAVFTLAGRQGPSWGNGALPAVEENHPATAEPGGAFTQESIEERASVGREPRAGGMPSAPSPPFLRRPFLFDVSSDALSAENLKLLRQTAGWLRRHPERRVLIIGFCDPLGSETCTERLAYRRGMALKKTLLRFSVGREQIVAVKAWGREPQDCRKRNHMCQSTNRSAQIFIAPPARR